MTLIEKWKHDLQEDIGFFTQDYLKESYPGKPMEDTLYINGAVCPDPELIKNISGLKFGQSLYFGELLVAARTGYYETPDDLLTADLDRSNYNSQIACFRYTWELFLENGNQIQLDFKRLTLGRKSASIEDDYTLVYHPENLFIETGVSIKAAIINAEGGPVYLGANSQVQEGTIIQGPFALGQFAQLRPGGKMRPNTTIGPWSKVGGEVGNVIFQSNSNKAHEGFLGNSYIGSWCNLGADTNNSNLKNNYSNVKAWEYDQNQFVDSGLQFFGTIMGDHSKCGINTMFNTGTVVGVSANIFGAGFPPKFVPSFSWGSIGSQQTYELEKALDTAHKVYQRRNLPFGNKEREVLTRIFHDTHIYRERITAAQ